MQHTTDLFKSMQDKAVPSLLSSLGVAVVSWLVKKVRDKWLRDKRRDMYKRLNDLNLESRTLRLALSGVDGFDGESLRAHLAVKRQALLIEIQGIETEQTNRGSVVLLPLNRAQRLLLLYAPRTARQVFVAVMFYWELLLLIFLFWYGAAVVYEDLIAGGSHASDWKWWLPAFAPFINSVFLVEYLRERALSMRDGATYRLSRFVQTIWWITPLSLIGEASVSYLLVGLLIWAETWWTLVPAIAFAVHMSLLVYGFLDVLSIRRGKNLFTWRRRTIL